MSLLNTIQTKVREQPSGQVYVESEVGGTKLQVTVDMERTPYAWPKSLPFRSAFRTRKKGATSRESTRRACQSMELLVVQTSKLDHGEVKKT